METDNQPQLHKEEIKKIISTAQNRYHLFLLDNIWKISDEGRLTMKRNKPAFVDCVDFIEHNANFTDKTKGRFIKIWDALTINTFRSNQIIFSSGNGENNFKFNVTWKFYDALHNKFEIIKSLSPEKPYFLEIIQMEETFTGDVRIDDYKNDIEKTYDILNETVIKPFKAELVEELNRSFNLMFEEITEQIQRQNTKGAL